MKIKPRKFPCHISVDFAEQNTPNFNVLLLQAQNNRPRLPGVVQCCEINTYNNALNLKLSLILTLEKAPVG